MKYFLLILILTGVATACIGIDDIGPATNSRDIPPVCTAARQGPAIPDNHWVAGVIDQDHTKCYHVYSFGSPHGVTDTLTKNFTSY